MFNVNNRNTRKRCEICSKLTIKTPDRRQKVDPCLGLAISEPQKHQIGVK